VYILLFELCKISFKNFHALSKYQQKLKQLFYYDSPCTSEKKQEHSYNIENDNMLSYRRETALQGAL